jgi:acyl CoA:acetate/3-ketoacid CoA transferase alpha subunit
MAITGLSPLIVFAGEQIDVSLDLTLVNGKTVTKSIVGNDIATWRPPSSARSVTITKVKKGTFAGALVTSVNGIGYFPFAVGSELARIEIPDSNIQVLNP